MYNYLKKKESYTKSKFQHVVLNIFFNTCAMWWSQTNLCQQNRLNSSFSHCIVNIGSNMMYCNLFNSSLCIKIQLGYYTNFFCRQMHSNISSPSMLKCHLLYKIAILSVICQNISIVCYLALSNTGNMQGTCMQKRLK